MSIFGKPKEVITENEYGVKVMFFHGLEGSTSGSKALHLRKKWSASCPPIRTTSVIEAREKCKENWSDLSPEDLQHAMAVPYKDVLDAVNYFKPDIIVGSSLGAALLYKLYAQEAYSGAGIFLAPAIPNLLNDDEVISAKNIIRRHPTVWVLGETDTIVPNSINAMIAKSVNGNLIYSPEDCHRLHKALNTGLIDAAVLTTIEEMNRR